MKFAWLHIRGTQSRLAVHKHSWWMLEWPPENRPVHYCCFLRRCTGTPCPCVLGGAAAKARRAARAGSPRQPTRRALSAALPCGAEAAHSPQRAVENLALRACYFCLTLHLTAAFKAFGFQYLGRKLATFFLAFIAKTTAQTYPEMKRTLKSTFPSFSGILFFAHPGTHLVFKCQWPFLSSYLLSPLTEGSPCTARQTKPILYWDLFTAPSNAGALGARLTRLASSFMLWKELAVSAWPC